MGGNFKFQVQDSDFEIWKRNLTFWKKAPLALAVSQKIKYEDFDSIVK